MGSIKENLKELENAEQINYMDWRVIQNGHNPNLAKKIITKDALTYLTQMQFSFNPSGKSNVNATLILYSSWKQAHPIIPGLEIQGYNAGFIGRADNIIVTKALVNLESLTSKELNQNDKEIPIFTLDLQGLNISRKVLWNIVQELEGTKPAGYNGLVRVTFHSAKPIDFQKLIDPKIGISVYGSYR